MSKRLSLALLTLLSIAGLTFGSGFSILEQSVAGVGRALAGMSASTDDPSALFFNPAGAAWAERPTILVGNHILTGDVRFHDDGSTLKGGESGDVIGVSFIPNFDLTYPIGDGLNFNLAMSATSGTATNYNPHWRGRYFAIETNISVLEVHPSISYRVSDDFAVAAGALFQYADISMYQAINTAAAGRDSKLKMDGDSVAYGFTLGMVYRPFEGTTVGIGYRSKMKHNADLKGKISRIPAPLQQMLGLNKSYYHEAADLALEMPQSVTFGVQQVITDKLTLMGDISWTDWSTMDALTLKFKKGTLTGKKSSEIMQWHDSWRFSLGAEYKLDDKWTLRCGTAYDQRAVTKHETKTCKLPDSNRYWACLGVSYQWNENLRLDLSWNHIFFQPSSIEQTDHVSGQNVKGKFTGYTDLVSFGIKYQF